MFLTGFLPMELSFSATVPRMVCTSPALTELVYQLGHGESLVGTTAGYDYPDAAKVLPLIGSLFFPSVEKTLKLNPDWILVDSYTENPTFLKAISNLGIKTLVIKIDSFQSLKNESLKILKTIFNEDSNKSLDLLIENSEKQLRPLKSFRFLGLVWNNPSIVFGAKIFLSSLLTKLGGSPILPETLQGNYPLVTEEWLIKHPPEVLFILNDSDPLPPDWKKSIEKWWPEQPPKVISLPHKYFARTNFTALLNLNFVTEKLSR